MKKLLYTTISLFIINTFAFTQSCLPYGITFSTQQEIDDFPSNYPGCTEIEGDVCIGDCSSPYEATDISNLIGLTQLEYMRDLTIRGNPNLNNLNGLNNIESIGNSNYGDLWIIDNSSLSSLEALSNLTSIASKLSISFNNSLVDLSGLENVTSIGNRLRIGFNDGLISLTGLEGIESVPNSLEVTYNESLLSLTGLDNITSVNGSFYLNNNSSLTNINALSNLTSINNYATIHNNDVLSDLQGLDNLTSIGSALDIYKNSLLSNLDGLVNLTSIGGSLGIYQNDNLSNIDGIANIDPNTIESSSNGADLKLRENPLLSNCAVISICDFLDIPGKTSSIGFNDIGCNSEEQVIEDCNTPDCTLLTNPLNGAIDVNITTVLSWESVVLATGYTLNIGTFPNGTDILDNFDVGNNTSYDPGGFSCGEIIYVTIMPYNGTYYADDCTEESFTTEEVIADVGADTEFCAGGSVQLNASGGTTYSWSPTDGLDDPNIANPVASPGATTTYTVTVSNDGRCPDTDDVIVTVNPNPIPNASATDETANDANDGTATSNPTSGTPAYSYNWSNGETTQTITDLAPGNYSITVTDSKTCTGEETVSIAEFICPTLTILEEADNIYCNGDCDGYISIDYIDNGVAPFEYLWSTGDTESSIDNICPDTYSVTVTDADNCQVTKTYEITEPDELLANATATNETEYGAQDGTAIANPTGGTTPYEYKWSTGAVSQSISNLSPGDYIVTVTDDNDCTSIETVTVNEFICPTLTVNANQTNVNCNGACNGEIEVTSVTNAVEPLSYDWSNGESTSYIENLCPGTYNVTVTDDKNCEIIQDYTITQPQELLANASATDETTNDANDGTATANPTGGVSPYSYAWSNGENTQTISGLAPGSYTVTVTDDNGCTSIESVSVAKFGCQGLAIVINQTNIQCNSECNGILGITGVTNGATPLTYTWSNGKTTAKIDSLCPGNYSMTVVDGNNCNVYGSYTVTEPQPLSANAISTDETANDANDGTVTSNPSGGTQAYAYNWSTGDTTQAISGLSPGLYFLTVTDANGCTALDTVTIIEFTCPNLTVNSRTSNISCFGACDGSIAVLSVINATSPLSYYWSTGATSASLSNLCAGDYSVTITDAKNCKVVQNYTLTQPDEITITVDSTRDVRLDTLGYIAITTNNNGNYIFFWLGPGNFTAKTEDLDSLSDFGCYTLTVTDTTTNCSIDSTICLEDKTATFDFEFGNINIYPNPTKGNFIIDFKNTRLNQAEITIFDLSGKQQLNLLKKTSDKILNVESEVLNAGLYIIRIKSAKFGTSFRKVILSK